MQYHGVPKEIISNKGKQFVGSVFHAFSRILGTDSSMSTAFHPQTDGQTERANRIIEETLCAFVSNTPDDWDELLPVAAFAINNARNSNTMHSPLVLHELWPASPHTVHT